jgi:hypothetical protein
MVLGNWGAALSGTLRAGQSRYGTGRIGSVRGIFFAMGNPHFSQKTREMGHPDFVSQLSFPDFKGDFNHLPG